MQIRDSFDLASVESRPGGQIGPLSDKTVSIDLDSDDFPNPDAPYLVLHPVGLRAHPSVLTVYTSDYLIGRESSCNFVMCDKRLSKLHCKISKDKPGTMVYVTDLSTNGTFLNHKRVGKGKKVPVRNGDHVHLLVQSKKVSPEEEIGFRVEMLERVKKREDLGQSSGIRINLLEE